MKALRNKLRTVRGMTLTEVLVAILILSIVTVGVAVGTGSAARVYKKSVQFSEALTLRATLSRAVMDELRYAKNVSGVTFSNQSGENVKIVADGDGHLIVASSTGDKVSDLVSTGAYNSMKASLTYTFNPAEHLFSVTLVIQDSAGQELKKAEFPVSTYA